jgi:hypothetical protein
MEMASELENMKLAYQKKADETKMAESKFSKAITDLTDVVVGLCQTGAVDPEPQPNKFHMHVESKSDKIGRFLDFAKSVKN